MRKLRNVTGQAFDMENFRWSSGSDGSIGQAYLPSDKYLPTGMYFFKEGDSKVCSVYSYLDKLMHNYT